jgi:hypothetical protein
LCKLNGFIGLAIVPATCGLTWLLPGISIGRRFAVTGAAIATVCCALAVAVALNPYLTAKPAKLVAGIEPALVSKNVWERFLNQVDVRLAISNNQKKNYAPDALVHVHDRAGVILVQGFGRFGPFGPRAADSRVRYDLSQDWGTVLWLPFVCFGLYQTALLGLAQLRAGRPPAALVAVVWAIISWVVVTLYLPMAWDRYQLPIQSGNALLAAVGVCAIWERLMATRRSQPDLAKGS